MGAVEGAVATDGALNPGNTSTVNDGPQRGVLGCFANRGHHVVGPGDVAVHEGAVKGFGEASPTFTVNVADDDVGAGRGQRPGGGGPEARSPTGDEG